TTPTTRRARASSTKASSWLRSATYSFSSPAGWPATARRTTNAESIRWRIFVASVAAIANAPPSSPAPAFRPGPAAGWTGGAAAAYGGGPAGAAGAYAGEAARAHAAIGQPPATALRRVLGSSPSGWRAGGAGAPPPSGRFSRGSACAQIPAPGGTVRTAARG